MAAPRDSRRLNARCAEPIAMAERIRPIEQMLELSEEETMSPELLDSQQEQIEKQKRELEELSRRQEELERGRAEMTDKLSRSLVILEREGYDCQKKLETIRATHESFTQHLQLLEAIEPKTWNTAELPKELSRALSTVDDARTEFSQQRSRLEAGNVDQATDLELPEAGSGALGMSGGKSFAQWLQIGFAVTLPLIIFGIVALLIFFWMAAKTQ